MILKINDRIRTRKIEFFNEFKLNLKYDSVASTFVFKSYFDPANEQHKDLMAIGHYHLCTIEENNELLLTGFVLSESLNSQAKKELVSFGGYSLPGVLLDCEIPLKAYPLQSDGLNLRQIAEKFVSPFGIQIVITPQAKAAMEEPYAETTAKESQNVKTYLNDLASQKNIILTHDTKGRLVFTKAIPNRLPIFHFEKGLPGVSMGLNFDGQGMHSEITVIKQDEVEEGASSVTSTVFNPYVPIVYRPKVVIQSSTNTNDNEQTAKNILAQELRGLTLNITIDRWILNNKVVMPGNEITVINPEVYLYKKTRWFIEEVELEGNKNHQVAKLKCVIPEVYTGQTPNYIFKGINLR